MYDTAENPMGASARLEGTAEAYGQLLRRIDAARNEWAWCERDFAAPNDEERDFEAI
jgi:hypothetical protein